MSTADDDNINSAMVQLLNVPKLMNAPRELFPYLNPNLTTNFSLMKITEERLEYFCLNYKLNLLDFQTFKSSKQTMRTML